MNRAFVVTRDIYIGRQFKLGGAIIIDTVLLCHTDREAALQNSSGLIIALPQ